MKFIKKQIVFTLFICILTHTNLYSQIKNYDNSICWEITCSKASKPSYILGSIHNLDTTKITFPIYKVKELIDECSSYCMESNTSAIDSTQMKEFVSNILLNNMKLNFRDYLDNEYYEKLIHIVDSSKGTLKSFKRYLSIIKPGYIGFMVTTEKQLGKSSLYAQTNLQMDSYFQQYSLFKKYEIHGLESAQKTLDLVLGGTYKESIFVLKTCIDGYYEKDTIDLIKNYVNQNLKLLKDDAYLDSTMMNRNKVMADGIDRLLQNKTVFIVIGAAHLPYKFGVLNLLTQKGYFVKPYRIDLKVNKKTNKQLTTNLPVLNIHFSTINLSDKSFLYENKNNFFSLRFGSHVATGNNHTELCT